MLRNPRIVLINPPADCVNDDRLEPPLGLLYICSTLREHGYDSLSISDMGGCKSSEETVRALAGIPDADVYGVTCVCTNYDQARDILRFLRARNPGASFVIGGPNPSGVPDFTLADSGADTVVVGEGEDAFLECVNAFAAGARYNGIKCGIPRPNIDSYAFPVRDLVDRHSYTRRLLGHHVASVLSSRGCRHHCVHCNSVIMGGGSRSVRYRSPENIRSEIQSLRDAFSCFRFNDDHLTGHPALPYLLAGLRDLDIHFRIFARIEDLTDSTCRLLAESGCVHVSVGIESLNPDNLRILGKSAQIGHEANLQAAQSHGFVVRASFMVGLPFDSDATIAHYFNECSRLGIDEYAVYPLIPYPGSPLAQNPGKYGYTIINPDFRDYVQMGTGGRTCYALRHENFGPDDVARWKRMASEILDTAGVSHMSRSMIAT